MHSSIRRLPATATQDEVLEAVKALNNDETIDGFLVQLPLPKGLDEHVVTAAIAPEKDADGLHVLNLGALTRWHARTASLHTLRLYPASEARRCRDVW